jgi:polysaccharide biosynthesis protein PslG
MRIRARLAGLAATCCVALALTAPAAAAPLPRDFFGVTAPDSFDASPAFHQGLFADQKAVGGEVIRQIFYWSRIEPSRGSYNWAPYDSFMTSTSEAGMDVLATVGWPAAWASRCPSDPNPWACPPTSYADFGRFVAALIGRYGPEGSFWTANPSLPKRPIQSWQLWNEPNLRGLWGGAPNAAEYSEMLKAVAPYIRAADPGAEIVSAGVPNSYLSGAVPMTAYLEGMYAAGAQGSFDTLGLHIYCETPACSIGLVERARSIMNAHGDESAPIWVTEMGWASAGKASRFVTDLEGQAANLGELMGELVARHEELGVRGLVQYAWHDLSPQTNATDSQWNRTSPHGMCTGLTRLTRRRRKRASTRAPPGAATDRPRASSSRPPRRAPTSPAALTAAPRSRAPRRRPTPASRTALTRSRPLPPTPTGTPIRAPPPSPGASARAPYFLLPHLRRSCHRPTPAQSRHPAILGARSPGPLFIRVKSRVSSASCFARRRTGG